MSLLYYWLVLRWALVTWSNFCEELLNSDVLLICIRTLDTMWHCYICYSYGVLDPTSPFCDGRDFCDTLVWLNDWMKTCIQSTLNGRLTSNLIDLNNTSFSLEITIVQYQLLFSCTSTLQRCWNERLNFAFRGFVIYSSSGIKYYKVAYLPILAPCNIEYITHFGA